MPVPQRTEQHSACFLTPSSTAQEGLGCLRSKAALHHRNKTRPISTLTEGKLTETAPGFDLIQKPLVHTISSTPDLTFATVLVLVELRQPAVPGGRTGVLRSSGHGPRV